MQQNCLVIPSLLWLKYCDTIVPIIVPTPTVTKKKRLYLFILWLNLLVWLWHLQVMSYSFSASLLLHILQATRGRKRQVCQVSNVMSRAKTWKHHRITVHQHQHQLVWDKSDAFIRLITSKWMKQSYPQLVFWSLCGLSSPNKWLKN